jgi:putative hemolysin
MKLVEEEDFMKAAKLQGPGGESFAKLLMFILGFTKVNDIYSKYESCSGIEFITHLLDELEIKYEINPEELKRIPQGGFITVSNHPFGGIDGVLLMLLICQQRPDFKVMVNFLLQKIKPIEEFCLPVNPFENKKSINSSLAGIKGALKHVKEGHGLGIFPAGEVSAFNQSLFNVADKQWNDSIMKLIKSAEVPVVPIYFHGSNSNFFHLLGLVHPMLRTVKLPSELFNKKNKTIIIRIGTPISVEEQREFKSSDISRYTRYLRAKTYALRSPITDSEVKKFFKPRIVKKTTIEDIIAPVDPIIIQDEVACMKKEYLLFDSKNYSVICAPSVEMPNIITEIGRLREVTFREVGEGTNQKIDIDEFDLYYNQLFIWDNDANTIVGAYRVGKGRDIMERYGKKGFYIQTLFKISDEFAPILNQSVELGRSFIVSAYQRKPLPLFLLWKGILYFILKHPEYRYLIGPVSISNRYSSFSKKLIVNFLKENHYDYELAKCVKPRNKFKPKFDNIDSEIVVQQANADINKIDKFISDVEPEVFRLPILLKKYTKLGGKIISLNVDPLFNDCLDGLLVLDLFNVPFDVITSLSKEINDKSILDRFNQTDFAFDE